MGKNLLSVFEGLFTKVDKTEASYMKAFEQKEEQLLSMQSDLQEKELILKDMHKMKLLGEVSEDFFEGEQAKVEAFRKKYQEAQSELQLIQEYKTDDVKAILEEMEQVSDEHATEYSNEIEAIRKDLLKAKREYLIKLADAGQAYDKLVAPKNKIYHLSERHGVKNRPASTALDALGMIHLGHNQYDNLQVTGDMVMDAIRMNKLPFSRESIEK